MENMVEDKRKYYVVSLWKPSKNLSTIITKNRYVFLNRERAEEELKRCQKVVDMHAKFKNEFKNYRCTMNVYKTYKLKKGDEIADNKFVIWSFRSKRRIRMDEKMFRKEWVKASKHNDEVCVVNVDCDTGIFATQYEIYGGDVHLKWYEDTIAVIPLHKIGKVDEVK